MIRRELASYGIILSNLAEETKRKRIELSMLAQYVHDTLGKADATGDPGDSSKEEKIGLSKIALTLALPGTHECKCATCDPDHMQAIVEEADKRATEAYNDSLTKEVKLELREKVIRQYSEEITKDARQEVRNRLKKEVLANELKKYKIQLLEEVKAEYQDTIRTELTKKMEAQYQQRFQDMLMGLARPSDQSF